MRNIFVIGAGVNGLSCAIRLLETGHQVCIVARERTPHTTSDVAAAIFLPFGVNPWARVKRWAIRTRLELERLAIAPGSGIALMPLLEVYEAHVPAPWWGGAVAYRRAAAAELPAGYTEGFIAQVPMIEMPLYLPYLESRFLKLGGSFAQRELTAIEDVGPDATLCVNCSGLGARQLAPDPGVYPLRGQIVRIANNGITRAVVDESGSRALAHTIPRSKDVVAGGIVQKGNWSLVPDAATEREILAKAAALEPGLDTTRILGRAVGLRPGRDEVRLEAEQRGSLSIIHNYGHGGAGVSLSWGCADEVVQLVKRMSAPAAVVR